MMRASQPLVPAVIIGTMLICLHSRLCAKELPSILQAGDTFCTNEADFDDFASHGVVRSNSGTETCSQISQQTRIAVLNGRGGVKAEVRLASGAMAYTIGWTNGRLPVAR